MRNRNSSRFRLATCAAAAAISFATLLAAAPAKADPGSYGHRGQGPAVHDDHGSRGHADWDRHRPYPYPAPYRYAGGRRNGNYGSYGSSGGYATYTAYPGWRPAPVWIDGRWLLPPWPGAIWRAGFFGPRGFWVGGCWR